MTADTPAIAAPTSAEKAARRGFVLLIALLALGAGAKAVFFDTLDPDCFWHLKVADQLHAEGVHPLLDKLSFASRPEKWAPYSWLAELWMRLIWEVGGYRAAVAAQAVMAGGFIALVALAARQRAHSRLGCALATFTAALLSLAYVSFRPATAALVILAAVMFLLLRHRRQGESTRSVWLIIPLTAILANIHLYALLVPVWLAAWVADGVWQIKCAGDSGAAIAARKALARRWLLLALCFAASLANPMLGGLLASARYYQFDDPMVASHVIAELQPFWRGPMGKASAALVAIIFIFAFLRRGKLTLFDWLMLVGNAVLLLRFGRFAPLFAIAAVPVYAAMLDLSDRVLARKAVSGLLILLIGIGLWRVLTSFPSGDTSLSQWLNRLGPDTARYPCAAADFVEFKGAPRRGRLINEFTWGGYLEWRLYPQFRVLLDGRTQVFRPGFWQSTYLGSESDRREVLSRTSADAALLPIGRSLFRPALQSLGWTSVYRDDVAEVLVPPAPGSSAER